MQESMPAIGGILVLLILAALGIAFFAFWLWMLIHAITNKGLRDTEKVLWVLLIVLLAFLGPVLYFFIGRPKGNTVLPV